MQSERVLKTYNYKGREVGRLVQTGTGFFRTKEFKPNLSESEAIAIANELPPRIRVHMRTAAYPLFKLLNFYEIDGSEYFTNDDIMITAANLGCRNLTQLKGKDRRAYNLVKQRKLEEELFQDF